jgi:uncharacterized membrane protein YphA (DoxX/SURF4 family)
MRIVISAFLLHGLSSSLASASSVISVGPASAAAGAGILLVVGLWTPAAGVFAALMELWIAYSLPAQFWPSVLAATIALGLALVGPGAWSIDARSYGRKRISIRDP